jgi:HEAT repeat protein/MFS family permease
VRRPRFVARFIDLRPGESRIAVLSALLLMLMGAGYTALETARDALLVTRLPQRQFGVAYIAVAACSLPAAALVARIARRWDPRRVLLTLLLVSAAAVAVYCTLPVRRLGVIALYVTVGLVSSGLFPQFWVLVGTALTVGQSRRLIGPIAAAGVVGNLLGASVGAAALPSLPIRGLIAVAAAILFAAGGITLLLPRPPLRPQPPDSRSPTTPLSASMSALREEPFLVRVAILVAATTATALVIDYFFKSTVARTVPSAARAVFIARYYAGINVIALVVQLFFGDAIVRNLGVATAIVVTPILSVVGGAAAFIGATFSGPVLVLKAADATLRSSINRLTTELVYLPASALGRARAKPFIDGALARMVQALTAGTLLGLASAHVLTPRIFAGIIVSLSLLWLVAAATMRRHYLGQLRRSVAPALLDERSSLELDLPSAELIIEHLGSDDPLVVLAAINTLGRRGHERLIPALVLLHPDERVLMRALEIFASGPQDRGDWHTLAGRLLEHGDDRVRIAAARALAAQGKLDFGRLASDSSPAVRGYAAFHEAVVGPHESVADDPRVVAAVHDESGTRIGLLAALADADPSPRLSGLLLLIADHQGPRPAGWTRLFARAAVRQGAAQVVSRLIEQLSHWEDRETIRDALVALGEPAFTAVATALEPAGAPRGLRVHLPQTLGRFGTPAAAAKLLDLVEHESDGLVRYKALRALGRLVADFRVGVDRDRIARCVRANLMGYFALIGLRVALGTPVHTSSGASSTTFRLFTGLLDDKVRQSVERVFRLLKLAHPKEDIHRVYLACLGSDKRARANASEFLDALLWRGEEKALRALIRILSDDLSPEAQANRAAAYLRLTPPRSHEEAVEVALADADIKVAALAALYATATGVDALTAAVRKAYERRPSLAPAARGLLPGVFDLPLAAT